jgi:AcrR family transcriptional regulator
MSGKSSTRPKTSNSKQAARTDRRILRSRNALGDALVALLHEKIFDQITVEEVLARAGVGRSTFYEHFSDKNDLFLSDVEDALEYFSTLLTRTNADPRRLAPVKELFGHIRESREFFAALVKSGKMEDVLELGRGYFARSIEERIRLSAAAQVSEFSRVAQAHALTGAMLSLLDWWMKREMTPDPEELDELFHCLAWNGLICGERP